MSGPSPKVPRSYSVRLSPRAQRQLGELSPLLFAVVEVRLSRLAHRGAEDFDGTNRVVQAQLVGKTFRAVYEIDHDEAAVTVLNVENRR